ncbi:MAG: TRAP transporter small permease subunit [Sedimentitalea sp.]|uniref:TRAP transporter small permease subunit n=1 Tax=Sedimentitalea sp. TaxID=2048915 RepID=UPI003267ADE8
MIGALKGYVRVVDAINYRLGRIVMYGIFVMVAILLWSSISKTFSVPSLWTLEMAQFAMVAYYILGGPYSLQLGSNVRMDLLYGEWSDRRKAGTDAITVLFLIFYLAILLWGGIDSTIYSFKYGGERSPTAWRPYLWPIKVIMITGIALMLLQAISELFKDILRLSGQDMGEKT